MNEKERKNLPFFFSQGNITTGYTHSQLHPTIPDSISFYKQLAQPSLWIYFFQSPQLQMTPGLVGLLKTANKTTPEAFFKLVHSILHY
jgi:hypothetical protein